MIALELRQHRAKCIIDNGANQSRIINVEVFIFIHGNQLSLFLSRRSIRKAFITVNSTRRNWKRSFVTEPSLPSPERHPTSANTIIPICLIAFRMKTMMILVRNEGIFDEHVTVITIHICEDDNVKLLIIATVINENKATVNYKRPHRLFFTPV